MGILIGADIVPTEKNRAAFCRGDKTALLDERLTAVWDAASFRIANLECPLTDTDTPLPKNGPHLRADTAVAQGLRALSLDLVTLSNNHILDQDQQGFHSTLDTLQQAGIAVVGAGLTPTDAAAPYVFTHHGKTVGVYACAEHEFSLVSDSRGGANPYEPLTATRAVAALKTRCDYVIVLYHGGKECYRYPSPGLQATCHALVEAGADLVVCQHSHCVGCKEAYRGATIVYGQGNFIFDKQDNDYWNSALLIAIEDDFSLSFVPIGKRDGRVCLAIDEQAEAILQGFLQRSEAIKQTGFIEAQYRAYAKKQSEGYLLTFCRQGLWFRAINKLSGYRFQTWYLKRKFPPQKRRAIRNLVECEALRELFVEGLDT